MNGERKPTDFRLTGQVKWKGDGDAAIGRLSDGELKDYIQMLENAVYQIHAHFYYFNPSATARGVTFEDIGFDGAWKHVGCVALSAALRMYEVHRTPFTPVPMPAGMRRNIK